MHAAIFPIITTIKHPTTMAEARVVIDLIHGEESEEANMNGRQPRHTWTSEEKANLSNFQAFLCPIMMEPLQDPVVAKDGHTYSSAALKQWLSDNDTSPTTREYIANDAVFRNFALQAAMEEVAHYSAETEKRLTKCNEKEKMLTMAMNLMKTMLQSETAKVNNLENKIQMMTKERDNNDLKNANIAEKILSWRRRIPGCSPHMTRRRAKIINSTV